MTYTGQTFPKKNFNSSLDLAALEKLKINPILFERIILNSQHRRGSKKNNLIQI